MRVVIVGGVAGGAGTAARLRRLDEKAEIILIERGANISYANCGLPYSLGKVIPERKSLLLMTPEIFRARFNVDVRVRCEALSIDRENKSVRLRYLDSGLEKVEKYDTLVLATGSEPCPLPIPGVNLPGMHKLWTLDDMDRLEQGLTAGAKRAVVVGGGFVGVELAENLHMRGLEVTLVELADFIMPCLDWEMSNLLVEELRRSGMGVELGVGLAGIEKTETGLQMKLSDGRHLECDLGVLCLGVRPNSALAREAGLELGLRGHIVVDEQLRTSDPDIFAVGDVIEVIDPVFKGKVAIPLAGPANRQARIVADNICGRNSSYKGTLGTSIIKVNKLTAANVGYSERLLKSKGVQYEKIYLHPASHATYYPGGAPLHIKVLFNKEGRIFGAQIVGQKGVDKRIDALAIAMLQDMDIRKLAALELAYAPPYSSAKDPVNFVGMIAENILNGTSRSVHFEDLPKDAFLLDVREKAEFEQECVPGAINIPMGSVRERHAELPRDRKIFVYCRSGVRSYVMERLLRQLGYDAVTVSGGILTWRMLKDIKRSSAPHKVEPCSVGGRCQPMSDAAQVQSASCSSSVKQIDLRSLPCPEPIMRLQQEVELLQAGQVLTVLLPLAFEADLRAWSLASGNQLLQIQSAEGYLQALIQKGSAG
ncbi:MAG: FAD-dependent oxidoreductase [Oligosphaeraceae bacterium]|nr:FAD-dependent oxidoreductase [Oligosphaeraceae bacterium]